MKKIFYTIQSKWKFMLAIPLVALAITVMAATCDDSNTVNSNSNTISSDQPIPAITYSDRREMLLDYEGQVLNNPYLRSCTLVTSRGGIGTSDPVIGIAMTLGMPVNLSNQVTAPTTAESDGVYVSTTQDATIFKLRNGRLFYVEADANAVTGDCAPGANPQTALQRQIDYQENLPQVKPGDDTGTNFLPKVTPTPSRK